MNNESRGGGVSVMTERFSNTATHSIGRWGVYCKTYYLRGVQKKQRYSESEIGDARPLPTARGKSGTGQRKAGLSKEARFSKDVSQRMLIKRGTSW
jgi:hypothetical protein